MLSDRVKNVVEEVEPRRHLIVPVVMPDDGEPGTVYMFKTGQGGLGYCVLDREYNPTEKYFADIPQKQTTEFILLDRSKVDGWHWFDCEVGLVRSRPMIEKLGDTLPDRVFLVPMGVRG